MIRMSATHAVHSCYIALLTHGNGDCQEKKKEMCNVAFFEKRLNSIVSTAQGWMSSKHKGAWMK